MTNSHMDKFPYRITAWEFVHMVISSTSISVIPVIPACLYVII